MDHLISCFSGDSEISVVMCRWLNHHSKRTFVTMMSFVLNYMKECVGQHRCGYKCDLRSNCAGKRLSGMNRTCMELINVQCTIPVWKFQIHWKQQLVLLVFQDLHLQPSQRIRSPEQNWTLYLRTLLMRPESVFFVGARWMICAFPSHWNEVLFW